MRLASYLNLAVDELLRTDLSHLTQSSAYDTSWAARLTDEDGSLAYPHLLENLTERQHIDGSWGSRIPYIHDRLLSTLAVVLLLGRFGSRQRDHEQRLAGEHYIWQHAGRLDEDVQPTAGFEMILPTLLDEGQKMGLDLPYAQLRHYEIERDRKLQLLPTNGLFERKTTALFSLEAFADAVDPKDIASLLSPNGSVVDSPSATAWLLSQVPDWRGRFPESAAYLEEAMRRDGGGLPVVEPCGIFIRSWVIYYLHCGCLISGHEDALRPHYDYLRNYWSPGGVGSSPSALPDSDDTSTVLLVLHRAGYDVDGTCLLEYEREEHFAVFDHERHPSISANLHVLEALETLPEKDRPRVRDKILSYVLDARDPAGCYWGDKWHASVYYPTSQVLIALLPHVPEQMDDVLDWLVCAQRTDGSWGQYVPTAEETGLVLLALLHYYRAGRPVPREPLHLAARYLMANERPFKNDYAEMWTAKVLYAPTSVIRSIVLSALGLYQATLGEPG